MFPSVAAAVAPTIMMQLHPMQDSDEVLVDDIRYIVGERAIGHAERFSNLHNMWWTLPHYRALIAQAKKFIPDGACIVTGLPLDKYMAQQGMGHVAQTIKSGLRAQHVTVIPQGVGAYFSEPTLEHPRNKVALVDIGTWTTEFVAMTGQDLISQASVGIRLGINDIRLFYENDVRFLEQFGLKALEPERVTARQIEAARRAISRHIKRGGRIFIRIFPDKPISQKPAEVRMGNGKGNPEYYVAEIQPGKVLYEINGVPEQLAREAFTLAAAKLPLRCTFVARQVGA